MARDCSSSAGLGGVAPDGSTSRPESAWVCSASSRVTLPTSTVVRPTPGSRPMRLATCGRRRSPSTSTTFCPALAIAIAMLAAVVDLPSPGIAELITNALLAWSTSRNCRLVRSTRKASTRGAWEGSEEISGSVSTDGSWPMPASTGALATSAASSPVLTVVSSSSRSTARPKPSSRPSTRARPRLRTGCGDDGEAGSRAGSIRVALTSAFFAPGGVSSSSTNLESSSTTDSLIRCAWIGSGLVTEIESNTVSGTTVAVISPASSSGVSSRPRFFTTRSVSSRPLTRSAYDDTRCWENSEPW